MTIHVILRRRSIITHTEEVTLVRSSLHLREQGWDPTVFSPRKQCGVEKRRERTFQFEQSLDARPLDGVRGITLNSLTCGDINRISLQEVG